MSVELENGPPLLHPCHPSPMEEGVPADHADAPLDASIEPGGTREVAESAPDVVTGAPAESAGGDVEPDGDEGPAGGDTAGSEGLLGPEDPPAAGHDKATAANEGEQDEGGDGAYDDWDEEGGGEGEGAGDGGQAVGVVAVARPIIPPPVDDEPRKRTCMSRLGFGKEEEGEEDSDLDAEPLPRYVWQGPWDPPSTARLPSHHSCTSRAHGQLGRPLRPVSRSAPSLHVSPDAPADVVALGAAESVPTGGGASGCCLVLALLTVQGSKQVRVECVCVRGGWGGGGGGGGVRGG